VKRDSTSKLTGRFMGRSRIFWIFCMKSVELITCDSDFLLRSCSVCARKRDKLYEDYYDTILGYTINRSEGDV